MEDENFPPTEQSASVGYAPAPATMEVVDLLQMLGRAAPQAVRNKHKIYSILRVAHDTSNYITETGNPPRGQKDTDISHLLDRMEQYCVVLNALEEILLEFSEVLRSEITMKKPELYSSWLQSQSILGGILNKLCHPPFPENTYKAQDIAEDSFFDDCSWLSRLLYSGIDAEVAVQFAPPPVANSALTVTNGLHYLESQEQTRALVLDIAASLAQTLAATSPSHDNEPRQGGSSPWGVVDRDRLIEALAEELRSYPLPVEDYFPEVVLGVSDTKSGLRESLPALLVPGAYPHQTGRSSPDYSLPLAGSSRSEHSLKESSSRLWKADGGPGDHVIAVDDIVIQESEPFDVTGHFSDLFIGIYKGNVQVAMKRLRIGKRSSHGREIEKLEREAAIWLNLKHPYILHFMGIYRANDHMYLVSPFMEKGNLVDHLRRYPDRERISFLRETADAAAYLHAEGIVHADIKARNILVSESYHAKLFDFGLAKHAGSITSSASKGQGSSRWQAPEILEGASHSFVSDTYAFGITIAEVLSGDIPFPHLKNEPAVIQAVLFGHERPIRSPTHSRMGESYEKLWNIAAQCWQKEPQLRPRMNDVYSQLCASDPESPQDASGTPQTGEPSPTSSTNSFATALEGVLNDDVEN